ncbi:MAG: alpha/beta fold hydrolase [Clostridia bacterium]|nr:alpha/beta fold hydrolase [Clostridia bacterium]
MRKIMKRVIAFMVCASLLASALAPSASALETDCGGRCEHSPVIVLPGINHSPTYLYDENDDPVTYNGSHIGSTLLILNEAALSTSNILKLVGSALGTILLQTNVGLDKVAYNLVSEIFKYQRCDDKGDHVENLQTKRWDYSLEHMSEEDLDWTYRMVPMQALVNEIGEDHVYFFTFNLVGDPMDSADDLAQYIEMVKEQTGHEKVTLLPVSLGGTILTAYLEKYGHGELDQIVNAVACLDGTDIVADFFAREWRLDDEYLYHQFMTNIFIESEGEPTLGYLINTLLHIIPRSGVDALLSGAISAILDTLMLNCPQFWAMLPSYRYEALAERYLSDKPELKARTDSFQTARLNLKQNILDAVADGVRVNSISGSNLDFGEEMYTYFNIVASAEKHNSDGIVNLSSTTLGATGAPGRLTLADVDYEKNTYCTNPDHNHVSPDNMVDASTAILPENTWIFLDQYHEVGYNDVVLNLAKAIILGEVTDVNDNPEMYPQYNYPCYTQSIRRWKLPDAKRVDQSNLSEEDKAELNAAIAEGEAVLKMTVADQPRVEAAEARLIAILHKVGAEGYENIEVKKESALDPILEDITYAMSKGSLFLLGGGSLIDRILSPFRALLKLITK